MVVAAKTDADANTIVSIGIREDIYMTVERLWKGDGTASPRVYIGFDLSADSPTGVAFYDMLIASGADFERIK